MNVSTVIVQRSPSFAPAVEVFKKPSAALTFAQESRDQIRKKYASGVEAGTIQVFTNPAGHCFWTNEEGCHIGMVLVSKERVQ